MKLFTIGFTHKSAQSFFEKIREAGVARVVDVRLNNVSQLAGFSKKSDLEYFLKKICNVEYIHMPILAPTEDILKEYKKNKGSWDVYEKKFLALMKKRKIENNVSAEVLSDGCLLCSEEKPHNCHRRLVAEYLKETWGNIEINHIA
jgi:uncharacterized protein (DUF488 family)